MKRGSRKTCFTAKRGLDMKTRPPRGRGAPRVRKEGEERMELDDPDPNRLFFGQAEEVGARTA